VKFQDPLNHWGSADSTFHNKTLEAEKKDLGNALFEFVKLVYKETFGLKGDFRGVPPEWKSDQRDRYVRTVEELDRLSRVAAVAYDKFILAGKKILKV
jgi:hypothetical protein